MLTEAEKKWLKARRENRCKGGYFAFTSDSIMDFVRYHRVLTPDWKDCAEFEARLNKRLLEGQEIDMPCSHLPSDFSCPYTKVQLDTPCQPCEWCNLKELRLMVEAEMEAEDK